MKLKVLLYALAFVLGGALVSLMSANAQREVGRQDVHDRNRVGDRRVLGVHHCRHVDDQERRPMYEYKLLAGEPARPTMTMGSVTGWEFVSMASRAVSAAVGGSHARGPVEMRGEVVLLFRREVGGVTR